MAKVHGYMAVKIKKVWSGGKKPDSGERLPSDGRERGLPRALRVYARADFVTQLKARFVYYLCISISVVATLVIGLSLIVQLTSPAYGGINLPIILAQVLGIGSYYLCLFLLIRGHYAIAAHLLLVAGLLTVWGVMIVDSGAALYRLDSVVLVLAVLTMAPLVVSKYKQIIPVYVAGNIAVLFVFVWIFFHQLAIPGPAAMDYLADTTMALVFSGVVGYNIFRINRAALDRAEEDIEERKKAEDALSFQKSVLEAQTEASRDGILVVDGEGKIISYNGQFMKLWGVPENILVTRSDQKALDYVLEKLQDSDGFLQRVQYLYEHRTEKSSDEVLLKDGRIFDRYSSPIWGNRGDYLGRVWYFSDITGKKESEKALRTAMEEYERVVASIPSVVWKCDMNEKLEFTNMYISERVDDLLALPPGTINHDFRRYFSYMHPKDIENSMKAFQQAMEQPGVKTSHEYRIIRADGEIRWFYSQGVAHKNDYGGFRVYGVSEDISERKAAEEEKSRLLEQLAQSQRMESIGRLAGGIAHDFNNLLTAITGNIDLSNIDIKKGRSPEGHLSDAKNAAMSAANLTRQLLAFSRKQMIEPKIIDLVSMVKRSKNMLERIIGENIRLAIEISVDKAVIKSDPGQMEQIIVNLAVNARDAMPDGGTLTISVNEKHLDDEYVRQHPYTSKGRYVVLAVADTGTGIPEEIREHLFEPFFTTKPKGKGTGLGLATTYGAVKQNNGYIEVASQPGRGSAFTIFFPGVDADLEEEEEKDTDDTPPKGGNETILLVEDDGMVRNFAGDILQRLGYTIITCDTAESALEKSLNYDGPIHLLVTDVVLPGMNGRVLAETILLERGDMKVLYSSGYNENIIAHHGVIEEGISFIGKPYTLDDFARKIRDVLDNDRND